MGFLPTLVVFDNFFVIFRNFLPFSVMFALLIFLHFPFFASFAVLGSFGAVMALSLTLCAFSAIAWMKSSIIVHALCVILGHHDGNLIYVQRCLRHLLVFP